MNLPRYFLVNGRPVRFVATPDGGLDVEALDWGTGGFTRAMEYLTRCLTGDTDVDEVDTAAFDDRVARIRATRGS